MCSRAITAAVKKSGSRLLAYIRKTVTLGERSFSANNLTTPSLAIRNTNDSLTSTLSPPALVYSEKMDIPLGCATYLKSSKTSARQPI